MHFDLQYHFVRNRHQRGDLSIRFVPTAQQRADMFTKALGGAVFLNAKKDLRIQGLVETRSCA
jgi:hypothetical protein